MKSIRNQYASVQKKINVEKRTKRDRTFSALFHSFAWCDTNCDSVERAYREHEQNMFALLCMKLNLFVRLSYLERLAGKKSVKDDISSLIDYTQKICLTSQIFFSVDITDEFLSTMGDVLYLICHDRYDDVCALFAPEYTLVNRCPETISKDLYNLLSITSKALRRMGYREQSISILERMCELSRQVSDADSHRRLVRKVLIYDLDEEAETIIRIAKINEECFENVQDAVTGDFYWSYGEALGKINQLSEAMNIFEKCYKVRAALYGEEHWDTAIAKRAYALCWYSVSQGKYGREELVRFVLNAEAGKYTWPFICPRDLRKLEGQTIITVLYPLPDKKEWETSEKLLDIFEDICEEFEQSDNPVLKRRAAKYLRGIFGLMTGNYIMSESALKEAICSNTPENTQDFISDYEIKSALLCAYCAQNDKEAIPLFDELMELADSDPQAAGLKEKDKLDLFAQIINFKGQNLIEPDNEEVQLLRKILDKLCKTVNMMSPDLDDNKAQLVNCIIRAISRLIMFGIADREELLLYLNTLKKIQREKDFFSLFPDQLIDLNHCAAGLSWSLGENEAEGYFQEALRLEKTTERPLRAKTGVLLDYATFSARRRQCDTAKTYVEKALQNVDNMWKSCIIYIDDERLMRTLLPAQTMFGACYAVLRTITDVEMTYEKLLQFKAIASLASRERNRVLKGTPVDEELLREIRTAQDRIAAIETDSLFRNNTADYKKEKEELRRLETVFAQRFPENAEFMPITFEAVKRAIPDDSVVIEYYYCSLRFGVSPLDEGYNDPHTGIDIFITQKKDGITNCSKVTVEGGEQILSAAEEFVGVLQAESDSEPEIEQLEKKEELRALLYISLIVPVLPYLEGYENIYIAPDQALNNLPFEILYDDDRLEELAGIIKIECARDFLYKTIHSDTRADGSLIIGNPLYDMKDQDLGDRKPDKTDGRNSSKNTEGRTNRLPFSQLPFTQIEAEHIGKRLGSRYHTGKDATKFLLTEANQRYNTIHIATHGDFDLSDKSGHELFSSCLLFSGVNNWLKDGKVSEAYGNGIITADEISRMDLSGTELVVLSACLSGMNDTLLNKGFHGMISAFSAAGAHYVISHLWKADDFGTAVLMDAFYYYYNEKKLPPPQALASAKEYLRHVTVGDLKRQQWFERARQDNPDPDYTEAQTVFEEQDDAVRPFRGEVYWAGFTCYQGY